MKQSQQRKRKIGLYVRVSSDNQVTEEGSLKSQQQRLTMEVERRNMGGSPWGGITKVYVEEARSAKDTNRPEFLKMLQDVRAGSIDTIMVTELSRLSRSVADFLQIMTFLEKYDADFVCPQYNFDTTTPSGRVFLTIIIALAQFEREMTSERVKNNLKARAGRGLYNGGYVPLGFRIDPAKKGHLFVDETEAPLVVEIFDLVLKMGSVRQAVKAINARGIKNKKIVYDDGRIVGGGPFNKSSLITLLTNHAYIGKREINRDAKHLDQSELDPCDKHEVIDAVWSGIIEESVFQRVQNLIDHNRTNLRNNITSTYPYILSGLLKCESCGTPYLGVSANGRNERYYYYQHKGPCSHAGLNRIDAPSLEKFVLSRVKKIADDQELLGFLVEAANKQNILQIHQNEALLRSKKSELADVERDASSLVERLINLPKELADGVFIQKKFKDLESRKAQLEVEIGGLMGSKESARDSIVVLDEIKKTLQQVLKRFHTLSVALQRDLLRQVISEILITPTQLKIVLFGKAKFDDSEWDQGQGLLTTGSYVGRNGSSGRTRTADQVINSHLLYRLSY